MNWQRLLCSKRSREHRASAQTPDPRSGFERDYQRIIGSASFRRLQDKTQVFPLDKSDFVRTRLTHSLEVSSFAKSLGQMIFKQVIESGADKDVTERTKEDICSVLECAGLIHDIGNPPFGHFGEDYIREWFSERLPSMTFGGRPVTELLSERMRQDLCNFEGNAQALRLLTKLHFLVDEHGMNLNFTLLSTIIKYPVSSLEINKHSGDIKTKKMGYYYAEEDIFRELTENTGAVNCRHPLAFILEAADDIAYKTADIEDAVKKGFITYIELTKELKSEKYLSLCADETEKQEYLKAAEVLEEKYASALEAKLSDPEKNAVQNWMIYVQSILLKNASDSFLENYGKIMEGSMKTELLSASNGNALAYALGDIALRYVFRSKPIYIMEIAEGTALEFLLDRFVHAAVNFDTDYPMTVLDKKLMALVSENYIRAYKYHSKGKDEGEKLYLRLMLVTDFICGMTDSYAMRLYRELSGIE